VDFVVNNACSLETSYESIELAKKYDFFYATVGVHPHSADEMTEETIEKLKQLASYEKVVAIGEIGLDYYYDNSPRDIQRYWFERQLRLASELHMPVTIHDRDAHGDVMEILKRNNNRGIIHCYSGSAEMAEELVKMGYYLAFGGSLTFKNAKNPVLAAAVVPLDRLLIETDCPYLAPEGFRGKRNDSSLIFAVCDKLAEIKGITREEMAEITSQNARKVYEIN
jgi:TatD DNase family protein